MAYYFAAFLPAKEGGYAIKFPDFPEGVSQGADFDEAMEMAADMLATVAEEYAKARREMPEPSEYMKICCWAEEHMHDKGIAIGERPCHIQAFALPVVDTTPVKISISLAKSVLNDIDARAKQAGYTRSGFLAAAAQAFHPQ